jgi:hypothetical protein
MSGQAPLGGLAKVVVVFERRSDGGLRIYSDDVPGFVLSSANADAAFADVQPALEGIISHMVGFQVRVAPLPTIKDYLEHRQLPPPDGGREVREYVTVRLAA